MAQKLLQAMGLGSLMNESSGDTFGGVATLERVSTGRDEDRPGFGGYGTDVLGYEDDDDDDDDEEGGAGDADFEEEDDDFLDDEDEDLDDDDGADDEEDDEDDEDL